MLMTDSLFHCPRFPFSEKQQDAVLKWAVAMGAKNVPSRHALEKVAADCLKMVGDPTTKVTFESGNVAYVNATEVAAKRVSICSRG